MENQMNTTTAETTTCELCYRQLAWGDVLTVRHGTHLHFEESLDLCPECAIELCDEHPLWEVVR